MIEILPDKCDFCGCCVGVCPEDAIELKEAEISIIIDYKGLNVEKMTQLRSELRNDDVQIEVVKNSLLSRASEGTGSEVLKEFFTGPNALVLSSKDPVAPAKILTKFAKDHDALGIKAASLNCPSKIIKYTKK